MTHLGKSQSVLYFYWIKVTVLMKKYGLVLIAGFRAGLAGLNLGYQENPRLKPRKPVKSGLLIFFM